MRLISSVVTLLGLAIVAECRYLDRAITDQAVSPKPTFLSGLSLWPTVTVSKFPPIIEFIAQRIQTQFSSYVYEDLSRPQTYDKPVYTLSPADLEKYSTTTTTTTEVPTTTALIENEEEEEEEEADEQIEVATKKPSNTIIEFFEVVNSPEFNSSLQIEYELKKIREGGGSVQGAFKGNSLYLILDDESSSEKPKIDSEKPNLNDLEHVIVIKHSGGEYKIVSDIQKADN